MEPNLFRNRWLALAFVGLVLIGAMTLVGSEGDEGLLDRFMRGTEPEGEVVENLGGPRETPSSELLVTSSQTTETVVSEPADAPVAIGSFASDEELIDDAEGFDTTPMIVHQGPDDEGTMLEAEGETAIVELDGEGSEF
jgi:hypothetical protein